MLQLQRTKSSTFFKKVWKTRTASCPIPAAIQRRHFANLAKLTFQPTSNRRSTAAPPSALQPDEERRGRSLTRSPRRQRSRSPSSNNTANTPASSSPPPPAPDAQLDADISIADVEAALKKLSASSASLGPLKAVLIKAGSAVLLPVLSKLFTAVLRCGRFPPEWAQGAITAIHKKGDTTNPNNYRGITVGHALGKLYALVINNRLTTWLETRGLRAKGQAGFRQGYRTVDNCFILRALAERARARGVKLYLCAVDFQKAFDSVDRPLLWAALQRSGIGGDMLEAIKAMYADVPVCVKTVDGCSTCFQSTVGVKQGCPLSPLLFGIFLDDFEVHLQHTTGAVADLPMLAGRRVPPLLFADDMFLISTSVAGLNAQLLSLQDYCDAKKLTVNTDKTQVMILRKGGGSGGKLAADEQFFYAGQELEVVKKVKYLGLTFSQLSKSLGFSSCADELAIAGRHAMFAMRRRAFELGACSVEQQLLLFDIFVSPVLSYGCEVWGVDLLDRPDCASERVHRWFCRRVQGLPKQAASAVVLAELGRQQLRLQWVRQLVRFWNRLQTSAAEPDRVLAWALEDNLSLMREGSDIASGSPCWCRRWLSFLQSAPSNSGTLTWLTELREEAIVERASAAFFQQALEPTQPKPNTASITLSPAIQHDSHTHQPPADSSTSSTTKFAYYLKHVRGDLPLDHIAPHLLQVPDSKHRNALSRFKTSCHDLRIERERYLPQAIKAPRHERTCLLCASPHIEDELHMIFYCPIYDDLRFEFADLFPPELPHSIPCFLSQDQNRVATFIYKCHVIRCQHACMSLAGSESAL